MCLWLPISLGRTRTTYCAEVSLFADPKEYLIALYCGIQDGSTLYALQEVETHNETKKQRVYVALSYITLNTVPLPDILYQST